VADDDFGQYLDDLAAYEQDVRAGVVEDRNYAGNLQLKTARISADAARANVQAQVKAQLKIAKDNLDFQYARMREIEGPSLELDREYKRGLLEIARTGRELEQRRLDLDRELGEGRLDVDRYIAVSTATVNAGRLALDDRLGTGRLALDTETERGRQALQYAQTATQYMSSPDQAFALRAFTNAANAATGGTQSELGEPTPRTMAGYNALIGSSPVGQAPSFLNEGSGAYGESPETQAALQQRGRELTAAVESGQMTPEEADTAWRESMNGALGAGDGPSPAFINNVPGYSAGGVGLQDDRVYAGGSPTFNERTGRNEPGGKLPPDPRMRAVQAIMQAMPPSAGVGLDDSDQHALAAISSLIRGPLRSGQPGALSEVDSNRTNARTFDAGARALGYDPEQVRGQWRRMQPGQGLARSA
jgi:hypothetical protein